MKKFDLGMLVATLGVNSRMAFDTSFRVFVTTSLQRYEACDWGTLSNEDKAQSEYAVEHDERIMWQYECSGQPKIWIITEPNRSTTTVLFPEEY